MFRRLPAALHAALAGALLLTGLAPFSDEAYAQGNSDRAHACQQGGYLLYMRADRTPFKNTGDCVKYGGVLIPISHPQVVQVATGSFWTSLGFAGSGFAPNSSLLITVVSLRPGVPFSFALFPSFGTDTTGAFPLAGAVWPEACLGYAGPARLTATDQIGSVASVDFQAPC